MVCNQTGQVGSSSLSALVRHTVSAAAQAPVGTGAEGVVFHLWLCVADKVGFEPTEPSQVQRFSRPPQSTTLPLIRRTMPIARGD